VSDPSIPLPRHFTDAQRATLTALARCILHDAPPSSEHLDDLSARCDARIAALPAHRRDKLAQGLDALGGRLAVLLATGRATRFADLSPDLQTRCFAAWGDSAIAPLRTAHQAVRRLVLAVYYTRPEVTAAIGYDGPLQSRQPAVSWEGPLPGEPRADEPVMRGIVHLPLAIEPEPVPNGIIPGRTIDGDRHLHADVVVIGTGAGGAVTAARLAEAGYEVVVLEAGAYHARADFTEDEGALNERLYADGALRTTDDLSFALLQGATVGGSSAVNWMIMLRTPPYVLDEWAREHGVYGMSPTEMTPVFERVERELSARDVPDDAHSANNRLVLDGARTLGWRASTARINADRCIRCGFCGVGCRHNAKQSVLLTYLPRALTAGATVYADARATHIEQRERDRGNGTPALKRVHAEVGGGPAGRAPRALTIDAPIVVIAGGAIETPALLQRSGLGGGGVGEWLRLHPTTGIMGVYDRDILSSTGIPLSTMCDEFIRWNGTDYGFWIECPPMHPSFTAAAMPEFGSAHASRMRTFRQLGVLIALTRDGADRQRSNGRVAVDRHGRTSIQYGLGHEDQRRVRASIDAAARLHLSNGAREVATMHTRPVVIRSERDLSQLAEASLAPNRVAMFSAHVNGTCRMGVDPARSGATPEGERHGVRGLYISDGSLLPTALGVNPQETIMAVATVLAERMATRHAGLTRA
jgi:choline dehydrogenase-like flavoprotein